MELAIGVVFLAIFAGMFVLAGAILVFVLWKRRRRR
jgi:hypothetical protein